MGGKSPKTSTQHRRNADNTIKKTFAYFNKALSFYSHFVHIFTVYYKRSRKDAPFYFRLQSPSPKGCRHPFPYWKKNIERKKTDNYLYLVYHSNIPSPLQEKQPKQAAFPVKSKSGHSHVTTQSPSQKYFVFFRCGARQISITYLLSHATTQSPSQKCFAFPRCGARQISAIKRTAYHASM